MSEGTEARQADTGADQATEDLDAQEGAAQPDQGSDAQAEAGTTDADPTPQESEVGTNAGSDKSYDQLNDRHLRLVAEFANFRRRAESDALGTWSRAQADLVERFLDVLDDLTRVAALDPADEAVTVQSIVEGIDLVEQKFVKALADAGAEVIAPAEGEAFDPEIMEAMMKQPTEDESLDDAVAQVYQKGYRMGQNLVRPARVIVFKAD